MSDVFKLHGDVSLGGSGGCGSSSSGSPNVIMSLDETMALAKAAVVGEYSLTTDAVQVVSFGGIASAALVIIKVIGGKVKARLTSADGATQAIPVDSLALILSGSVPYTALDLTRVPGVSVVVKVTLGEKA